MARSLEGRLERLERATRSREVEDEGPGPGVYMSDAERCKAIRAICRKYPAGLIAQQQDEELRQRFVELFGSTGQPLPWLDAELVALLEQQLNLSQGTLQDNATLERIGAALGQHSGWDATQVRRVLARATALADEQRAQDPGEVGGLAPP